MRRFLRKVGGFCGIILAMTMTQSQELSFRRVRLAVAAIERGAKILGVDGREFHNRLKAQGFIHNYLIAGYDQLHTQSFEYVADSTVEALLNWESAK